MKVKPILMDYATSNYLFDNDGNITGWDVHKTFEIKVNNFRALPVKVEITRNFPHQYWELELKEGDHGKYEKVDLNTVKFTLELPPRTEKKFTYRLTLHEGKRRD